MAIGIERAILLETDGGDWDPVATAGAIVDAIRAQEAAGGPFDLILFGNESADSGGFQVGIRVAAGARPADRHRGRRASRSAASAATARREAPGGGWESFELPLPAIVSVKEGINLPRYPSVPGRLRARKKEIERSTPERRAGRAREDRPPPAAGGGHERRPSSARAPTRRPPSSTCSRRSGSSTGERPGARPRHARRRRAGPRLAGGPPACPEAGRRDRRPAGGARRRRCRGRPGGVRIPRRVGRHDGARRRPSRPDARSPRRLGGVRRPGRRDPAAGGRRRDRDGARQRPARPRRRPARPADGGELPLGRARRPVPPDGRRRRGIAASTGTVFGATVSSRIGASSQQSSSRLPAQR